MSNGLEESVFDTVICILIFIILVLLALHFFGVDRGVEGVRPVDEYPRNTFYTFKKG